MSTCDLCSGAADKNAVRFSSSYFRRLVEIGLRPEGSMLTLGTVLGMSKDEAITGWVQQVMSDSTDWLLCQQCAQKAQRSKKLPHIDGDGSIGCDLCTNSMPPNSQTFGPHDVHSFVRAGARPPMGMLHMKAGLLGISKEQAESQWVSDAMSDSTVWMLCRACVTKLVKQNETAIATKLPEPAKEG